MMLMSRVFSGSPVPRNFVFILADGTFVVQWDESRVQDLLTGRYRVINYEDFGHPISDYELNQLKAAGRVEHYTRDYVWLFALPEDKRFDRDLAVQETTRSRVKSYYLNTALSAEKLSEIEALLTVMGVQSEFQVRNRSGLVAILGKNGAPFSQLKDAETAQKILSAKAPERLKDITVAFVETVQNDYTRSVESTNNTAPDLASIIASQTDTTVTEGKCVVLVESHEDERIAIRDLFIAMKLNVVTAATGAEGLLALQDNPVDMLVLDLQLPDMHGWQTLGKVKEITSLRELLVIVVTDHSTPADQAFALTVARVESYLVKPVSMARLRQNVWVTFKNHGKLT